MVIVHEQIHAVGDVLGLEPVRRDGGGDDLLAAVLWALAVGLVEVAIAHPPVDAVDALGLRRLLDDAHHRPVDGRAQHVTRQELVAGIKSLALLRAIARA